MTSLAKRRATEDEDRGVRRRWKADVGRPMEQHATKEMTAWTTRPCRESRVFILLSGAEPSIFQKGRVTTTMMMMMMMMMVVVVVVEMMILPPLLCFESHIGNARSTDYV
jgi:IS5 family transposase